MRIRDPKTTALIFASGKLVRPAPLARSATELTHDSSSQVCTGAKTEAMAHLAARKYARIIQKLGFPAHFKVRSPAPLLLLPRLRPHPRQDFTVQNIVASCDVKFPIKLEGLAFAHASFANVRLPLHEPSSASHPHNQYEPEHFPGLIYRMRSPKIVLLIFVSGKVVLTGGKVRSLLLPQPGLPV